MKSSGKKEPVSFAGVDAAKVEALVEAVQTDPHHVKAVKPLPSRKMNAPVPLTDCFIAPCKEGCPITRTSQRICSWNMLGVTGRRWR